MAKNYDDGIAASRKALELVPQFGPAWNNLAVASMDMGDPASAVETSGVRLGSPAVTTRGFLEADMEEVAQLIYLTAADFENRKDGIVARVDALCKKYPIYG
jgi:glycine/serine hydroxymethyltransferase